MSFIYSSLYLILCAIILNKFLNDGFFKLIMVIILPIIAYNIFSVGFGVFCLGACLSVGLGKPTNQNELVNASGLRRSYGSTFDIAGFALVVISFFV